MHAISILAAALLLGGSGFAVAQDSPARPSTSDVARPATTPASTTKPLDQGAALGVLSAINTAEIDAGTLALSKNVEGPVRAYAQRMVDEHGNNNRKVQNWKPDLSAAPARMQMQKGQQTLATLKPLQGAAFSKAYVDAMVKDHSAALAALDSKLIPSATADDVAAHLRTTRQHVQDHLRAAQRLQAGAADTAAH